MKVSLEIDVTKVKNADEYGVVLFYKRILEYLLEHPEKLRNVVNLDTKNPPMEDDGMGWNEQR